MPMPRLSQEDIANEVTMAVWNCLAELPQFRDLKPQDYPKLFDVLRQALRPFVLSKPLPK
jgi:hypothetical protein